MSGKDIRELLDNYFNLQAETDLYDAYDVNYKISAKTFEEAGVLTRDEGLVVTVFGKEFQITIVRSK